MDTTTRRKRQTGQTLIIFVISLPLIFAMCGLVIDGGYAFAQRRTAQNTADLAALAAARVLAQFVDHDTVNGTDNNVMDAIDSTVESNGGTPVVYGAPDGPSYVDIGGNFLGYVGSGSIPATAVGVHLDVSNSWKPFFLGVVGVDQWSAGASATARGGYRIGGPPAGNLLPIGVSKETYDKAAEEHTICPAGKPTNQCPTQSLEEGDTNVPGGFGWLKFGCNENDKNGNPFGLGQDGDGCGNDKPFLETEWGNPPTTPADSYGCCGQVGLPGSGDDIASMPGNKAAVDNSTPGVAYYINNHIIGFVPIWDYADGNGSNGYYHIVGYAGFELISVDGAKNIRGVLRQIIFMGPVGTRSPGFAGAPLAVELVR